MFAPFTDRSVAAEKQLWLVAGEKMLFANGEKGIALDPDTLSLKVVAGDDPNVIVHNPANRAIAHMLVDMPPANFPVALGVLYDDPRPTFEQAVIDQNAEASKGKTPDLQKLVSQGQTWQVEKEPRPE